LSLDLMPEELLTLCLEARRVEAEALGGFRIPPEWFDRQEFIRMRRDQCRSNPDYRPWGVRAIVLRDSFQMIGHIGFHEAPDPEHLRPYAPKAIEFGYSIFPEFQRRGFAMEAVLGLMQWCAGQAAVEHFILSIAPGNLASQTIARRLGFVKVGEQMDERDGLEDVLLLPVAQFAGDSA